MNPVDSGSQKQLYEFGDREPQSYLTFSVADDAFRAIFAFVRR